MFYLKVSKEILSIKCVFSTDNCTLDRTSSAGQKLEIDGFVNNNRPVTSK